ncbi:hypothetical protein PR048_022203 [Dryococelus australis]|uniref:Uncharacterized protein n=1 Tax=Dryococelus australis TaxID=614101 RepID=A0ABQ9H0L7_9NEOP|nr:hypothetical protein PR048_022203 [Dryococelus australis]
MKFAVGMFTDKPWRQSRCARGAMNLKWVLDLKADCVDIDDWHIERVHQWSGQDAGTSKEKYGGEDGNTPRKPNGNVRQVSHHVKMEGWGPHLAENEYTPRMRAYSQQLIAKKPVTKIPPTGQRSGITIPNNAPIYASTRLGASCFLIRPATREYHVEWRAIYSGRSGQELIDDSAGINTMRFVWRHVQVRPSFEPRSPASERYALATSANTSIFFLTNLATPTQVPVFASRLLRDTRLNEAVVCSTAWSRPRAHAPVLARLMSDGIIRTPKTANRLYVRMRRWRASIPRTPGCTRRPNLHSSTSRRKHCTARRAHRSDETLGVRVTVVRIAPSLLDLGRGFPTRVQPTPNPQKCVIKSESNGECIPCWGARVRHSGSAQRDRGRRGGLRNRSSRLNGRANRVNDYRSLPLANPAVFQTALGAGRKKKRRFRSKRRVSNTMRVKRSENGAAGDPLMISTCKDPGATRPGIEPGLPRKSLNEQETKERVSEEIWTALDIEVLRADGVE